MISHYSGPHYIWTLSQTAIAAHRFSYFDPTSEGLDALQKEWSMAGLGKPVGPDRNMEWARRAFAAATPFPTERLIA